MTSSDLDMHRSEPGISFRNIGPSGARRGEEGYTGVSGKDNSALEALQETRWGEDSSDNALFRLPNPGRSVCRQPEAVGAGSTERGQATKQSQHETEAYDTIPLTIL